MNAPNRRQLFAAALAAMSAARAQERVVIPHKRSLLVWNDRPEDLETPVKDLETWVTPIDAFFVRQHLPRPTVDLSTWRLKLDGRVAKSMEVTLEDLRKLPQNKIPATLECTGNGRGFYRPRVPGIQWGRGGVGNAEWSGPRLTDVLKLAGADLSDGFIETDGADVGVAATPDFIRSLPMKKALHPATILALDMNGAPLPDIHGGPARLIVPGWDGTSWVKWVTRLTAAREMNNGFFMNPGYRFPKYALPPGSAPVPAELEVIEGMPVKSTITTPEEEEKLPMKAMTIRGFAWAGEEKIARVDVSVDGGSRWMAAELSPQNLPFAWRLWKVNWTPPKTGYYTILSRATDSAGRVQPFVAQWNPSGYLYNAVDKVGITVEKSA
jgi:DMSO/TMAO reductase YedYZ molybdopterin-dependent catalytic subunit